MQGKCFFNIPLSAYSRAKIFFQHTSIIIQNSMNNTSCIASSSSKLSETMQWYLSIKPVKLWRQYLNSWMSSGQDDTAWTFFSSFKSGNDLPGSNENVLPSSAIVYVIITNCIMNKIHNLSVFRKSQKENLRHWLSPQSYETIIQLFLRRPCRFFQVQAKVTKQTSSHHWR